MIEMTDEEFDVVYDALETANSPYGEDEIADVITKERQAWDVVRQVRDRAGPSGPDHASGASPSS